MRTLVLIGLMFALVYAFMPERPEPLPTLEGRVQLDDWRVEIKQVELASKADYDDWIHKHLVKQHFYGNYTAAPRRFPCTLVWVECRSEEEASLVYVVTGQNKRPAS